MDQIKIPLEVKPPLQICLLNTNIKRLRVRKQMIVPMNFECSYVMTEGLPYPFPFHYFEFKLDVEIENSIKKEQRGF